MKNEKLKPVLIEYSSPKHKEGVRRYFNGDYKIDYRDFVSVPISHPNRSKSYNHHRSNSYVHSSLSLRDL